jgi:hypothetical protein
MPGTSVLNPARAPSRSSTVLAAPTSSTSGERVSSSGSTSRFSGIVSDSPRQDASRPSRNAASPPSRTSIASYRQSSPSAA